MHHGQLLDLVIFPLRRSRLSFFKRPILGIGLLLLILGHEPVKGALLLHELSLVLLLIGLSGANLRSLWNKCTQNTNTGGAGAVGTRRVG